ncbi:MAG: UbiA family prenyltransferase, partial [Bacteroidota bacterium]
MNSKAVSASEGGIKSIFFWLKVSRPGLWFATVWLYLLPTSGMDIWQSSSFWLGFVYVTFPLNFLVYGWNDIVDHSIDAVNPRKDNYWFGAKGSQRELAQLWKVIFLVQVLFFPWLIWLEGWPMLLLLLGLLSINAIYNLPEKGLRSQPPWELLCQVGYLLVAPFSCLLNDTAALPWFTYLYLLLFAFQSHLIGEVMDIEPDRKSGRRTTATILGVKKTKLIIIGIVGTEVLLLFTIFNDYIF